MKIRILAIWVVAVVAVPSSGEEKAPKQSELYLAMKKAHRGKDSPFQRLMGNTPSFNPKQELPWEELDKICESLAEVKNILNRPAELTPPKQIKHWELGVSEYTQSWTDLKAAVKLQDRKAVDKAVVYLIKSCTHCHHYFYPGMFAK